MLINYFNFIFLITSNEILTKSGGLSTLSRKDYQISSDYKFEIVKEGRSISANICCINKNNDYYFYPNTTHQKQNEATFFENCKVNPRIRDFKDKKVIVFDPISVQSLDGEFEQDKELYFNYYYVENKYISGSVKYNNTSKIMDKVYLIDFVYPFHYLALSYFSLEKGTWAQFGDLAFDLIEESGKGLLTKELSFDKVKLLLTYEIHLV